MSNGVETAAASTSAGLPVELQILELYHAHGATILGPTDVERMIGVSKGTASLKMKLLAEAGYLIAEGAGKYLPGDRFFRMCVAYFASVMTRTDAMAKLASDNARLVRDAFSGLVGGFGGEPGGQA